MPNTEVLRLCGISGIETVLLTAQFHWVGHVIRMDDNRIPKQIFFGQLSLGKRPQCGPLRCYKHTVKVNMKRCGLQPKTLTTAVLDRAQWRTTCQSAIQSFEKTRVAELERKRAGNVCLSVRLLNRLTFELDFLCVWVMTIVRLELKVKIIGQCQKYMFSAYGCGNAVTRSV